jgi:hypothetical protein
MCLGGSSRLMIRLVGIIFRGVWYSALGRQRKKGSIWSRISKLGQRIIGGISLVNIKS